MKLESYIATKKYAYFSKPTKLLLKHLIQERLWRSCRGVAEHKVLFHWPRLRYAVGFISVGD